MVLIVAQQKRIKNADYYGFGCDTVDGYEGNELTSNEDDGKWLEKAEKAITVKATKKRKVVTQRTSGDTYKNQQQKPQKYIPLPARLATPGSLGVPPLLLQERPPRMLGSCFNCLEMGYLQFPVRSCLGSIL